MKKDKSHVADNQQMASPKSEEREHCILDGEISKEEFSRQLDEIVKRAEAKSMK